MTKIDIISGFLGAGKTTFIKKMIDEVFKGEKIVLIENEFGEVGIDGGFLKDAGIQITEMNSGCICCSLVGDFGKNLHEVIDKYHPDRILIEPSGVGKLSDVMKSVIDIEKEEDVKLNGLVTVVNALKASKQMKAFGEFFNNQIEYATVVVLSRSQNATPEQLELCVKQIQTLNPKAAIITTAWDAIKGEQILKVIEGADSLEMKLMAEQHAKEEAEEHEHEHHHHDHDHEHEHEHEREAEKGLVDAHIWTDPVYAQGMVKVIADVLCRLDGSNAEFYKSNSEKYIEKLKALDSGFRDAVKNGKRDTVVFSGRFAFRNFTERYSLKFVSALDACADNSEPGARTVAKIVDTVRDEKIPVIFYEELTEPRTAEIICGETGCAMRLFHSCHNVSRDEFEAGVGYLSLMNGNLENLREALS